MDITIRKATPEDLDTLMQWRMRVLAEVFSLPPEADTVPLEEANRAYYRRSIADGSHIACFASHEDRIVGCGGICIYREMPSPDNPSGRCGYLMNIYTVPEYRGHGIGEKTTQWLISQAREQGVDKIFLESSAPGRGLYPRMGFVPMPDMMKLDI